MGRPEQPVSHPYRALGRLALGLRSTRHATHLTYSELAARSPGFSRPTLQRAASGKTLPTQEAVTAYARACDTDPGPLLALWKAAAKERAAGNLRKPAPAVRQIQDEADMGAALRNLHLDAGAPSCREIERRTRNSTDSIRVPRNTVHQILSRQRFPSSRDQLRALLAALGVPLSGHENWLRAWSRVNRRLQADRRATRARRDKLQRRITLTRMSATYTADLCGVMPAPRAQPPAGVDSTLSAWVSSLSSSSCQISTITFTAPDGTTTDPVP
ncbi:helix-turn-helix transcriptional regulator [Streptomyces sp. ISL-66]|uniref:helix-turn-helix domain-containing protein n=1 Tax=Streptomyces sp. ISL-66 TaxID=2819186 RepID=UPI001BEAA60A|nr:helix-turn-helix transcriptional regulator [Streptomyces sp. ISL-66]MBT2469552.1 helix-turn-helix transcriptional regulator [Streptomyces sp. ISL-66]